MYIYFLFIRIAAWFGHKKARLLVRGQAEALEAVSRRPTTHCIWIHAASVGEFEQARPLIERLRREQPKLPIVVTFFSPSGYEMRKTYDQADQILYLPFATRRNARRFIDAMQPRMAIFVKYEFWPAYLRELHKRNIPTYSISAIFRPEQLFFKPWGKRHLALLRCFTQIYVQDEASCRLLTEHGIHNASVAGDTRFDRMEEMRSARANAPKNERLRVIDEFVQGAKRVIVAGSTWPKDEELLVRFIGSLPIGEDGERNCKLILVPHETDNNHLHFIFQLFQGRIVRYSDVSGNAFLPVPSRQNILCRAQVLVIDTMGLLSSLYPYGQVAYIGGGFGVGIHNTVEAAAYGMPVIFGPNYHHFREAIGLIEAGAARSIKNYAELETALNTALDNYTELGAKAAAYVQSELGATEKIYTELFSHS